MPQTPPPLPQRPDTNLEYNIPLYGIRGEFSLTPNVTVPYFATLMDLKRLTRELKTHEEVNPSLETIYSLVELFQRNIDEKRVRREIVDGYLKLPSKLKFFNSLTVALLPKNDKGEIEQTFTDYENNDPTIPYENGQDFDAWFADAANSKSVFGGVQFVATDQSNLSRLRWDLNRVEAMAVDGQHRLRALKLWMQDRNNTLSTVEAPTRVPVIFLLLHESAGFKQADGSGNQGIKPIAREVFTDLNKNAREVDLATQIILDDRSIEAACVRSLVTDSTCMDSDKLIPLSMVRWKEANNRFDQKYFVNSLVNLHLLVRDLLGLEPPRDPMSVSDAKNFLQDATKLLGIGLPPRIEYEGDSLSEYYEKYYLDPMDKEAPIAPLTGLPAQFLDPALKGFNERFSKWLLHLLTIFQPYKNLLTYARENNLIEGEFSQYLSQPVGHLQAIDKIMLDKHGDEWSHKILGQHIEAIEKIKGLRTELGEQWPFKTIFQKAFVRLGKVLFVESPHDSRDKFGKIEEFTEFFDDLYNRDILRVHAKLQGQSYDLWTFIAVNYGNCKIKVATTSEKRIQAVLTLWYFAWRFKKHQASDKVNDETPKSSISLENVANAFSKKNIQSEWPVNDSYEELKKLFDDNAHIILGKQAREEVLESKRKDIAKERIKLILEAGVGHIFSDSVQNTPSPEEGEI
jgi:hypothetical protein